MIDEIMTLAVNAVDQAGLSRRDAVLQVKSEWRDTRHSLLATITYSIEYHMGGKNSTTYKTGWFYEKEEALTAFTNILKISNK